MAKLKPMRYGGFTWPHNPTTFSVKYGKDVVQHRYPGLDGSDVEELGIHSKIFEGTGIFFGPKAMYYYDKLHDAFMSSKRREKGGIEDFYVPDLGTYKAVFSNLELTREPTPNYVEYSFSMVEHVAHQIIKYVTKKPSTSGGTGDTKSGNSWTWKGEILRQGSRGKFVKDLQEMLVRAGYSIKVDGIYGPETRNAVLKFQRASGIKVDGVAGPQTYNALMGNISRNSWTGQILNKGDSGAYVKDLQNLLKKSGYDPGPIDGKFGPRTKAAVERFQKASGLKVDGIAGPNTYASLIKKSGGESSKYFYHTVKQGETLSGIGQKYKKDWRIIANLNSNLVKNPSEISVGWKLKIPR